MIPMEWGFLFAAISCALGIIGFIGGRQSSAKQSGAETATFKADIDYLKESIADIKRMLEKEQDAKRDELRALKIEFESALRRVETLIGRQQDRLDEHLKAHLQEG